MCRRLGFQSVTSSAPLLICVPGRCFQESQQQTKDIRWSESHSVKAAIRRFGELAESHHKAKPFRPLPSDLACPMKGRNYSAEELKE